MSSGVSWPIEHTTYRPDLLTVIEISPSTMHFQIAGSLWPIRRGCVPLHVHFPSSLSLTMHTSRSPSPLLSGVPQHHPDDHSFSAALQRTFLDRRALHFSAPTPFGASHASEQNPFVVVISYQLAAGGDKGSPSSTQTHSHSRRSAMLLNGPWN